jgi:hypothetical protein
MCGFRHPLELLEYIIHRYRRDYCIDCRDFTEKDTKQRIKAAINSGQEV